MASFFALGIASIISSLVSGAGSMSSLYAAVYLLAGSLLMAYAWKRRVISRSIAAATVMISTTFGFVILAPLMPIEFSGLMSPAILAGVPAPGMIAIVSGVVLTIVIGRAFCGHICPFGSIQELAYAVPVHKNRRVPPRYLETLRAVIFLAAVAFALCGVSLMEFTGVYDFFSLTLTIGAVVFALLICLSSILYRPVCRGICPFGLLFSLPAHISWYRLRSTGACISCRKCEKVYPAGVAGKDTSKRECYFCARCTDACPVPGALGYDNPA